MMDVPVLFGRSGVPCVTGTGGVVGASEIVVVGVSVGVAGVVASVVGSVVGGVSGSVVVGPTVVGLTVVGPTVVGSGVGVGLVCTVVGAGVVECVVGVCDVVRVGTVVERAVAIAVVSLVVEVLSGCVSVLTVRLIVTFGAGVRVGTGVPVDTTGVVVFVGDEYGCGVVEVPAVPMAVAVDCTVVVPVVAEVRMVVGESVTLGVVGVQVASVTPPFRFVVVILVVDIDVGGTVVRSVTTSVVGIDGISVPGELTAPPIGVARVVRLPLDAVPFAADGRIAAIAFGNAGATNPTTKSPIQTTTP
jgi:hypothetical protein